MSKKYRTLNTMTLADVDRMALHPLVKEYLRARISQGLTLRAVAGRATMDHTVLYGWEALGVDPTLSRFADVMEVLGYDVKITKRRASPSATHGSPSRNEPSS